MIRRIIRWTFRLIYWIGVIVFILVFVRDSTVPFGDQWTAVGVIARNEQFDYIGWEVDALWGKLTESLTGVTAYLTDAEATALVRAYMRDLATAQRLEADIRAIYTDPDIPDPAAASAELRTQRDTLRADLASRQSLIEAILERQITGILRELGFTTGGMVLPPVTMHFTPLPNLLIVSPRDQIRFDISINLDPMPIDAITALEDQIEREQNVSALIEPIGGLALYPAMILETTSIQFALETFAHEWLHHYLFAFPLGLSYDFAGEARIINETTAYQFGKEVGRLALERYYPDLVPPPPPPPADPDAPVGEPMPPAAPPAFDFGAELNETRVTVDRLLAEGQIEEAEAYMEDRRRLFVANGYGIRRINQAYFAFYGGYQTGSPGAGGGDPIGEAVAQIRANSATIQEWIVTLRGITTREELLLAAEER